MTTFGIVSISIRWKRLLGVVCRFKGHIWKHYTVIHPMWNSPGRFCERCDLKDIWHYEHETVGNEMQSYLVDSKGRRLDG